MYKKLIIIIPIVLVILVACLAGYYFITKDNQGTPNPVVAGFKSFFPFGGNNNTSTETTTSNDLPQQIQPTQNTQNNFTKKLRELSSEPVSGAGTLDVKAGTVVRYIEKATGHIFEIELFSPKQSRISNTTLPIVYEAVWGNKNASLITRSLKDDNQTVDTYSLTVKEVATSTENAIIGVAFPQNLSDVSVFGSSVFYLQQNGDSSSGFISNFDGSKKKEIWNSPLKELSSQYLNAKTVALTTKPAQNVPGFLYFVDTGSGQVKKVLGNISGLSILADGEGAQILYLEENDNARMYVLDAKANSSKTITPTTFLEKCLWSKKDKNVVYCAVPREFLDGSSLTSWYKGFISFTDDIWKYDIKNNISVVVENLSSDSGKPLDVIKPILSENEQYLVFINKTDNSLWSLDLTK